MSHNQIMPGTRVMVFDARLFKDDVSTPLTHTMRPATVLSRYGKICSVLGYRYPDLVDVDFDHRGRSNEHFTDMVKIIDQKVKANG